MKNVLLILSFLAAFQTFSQTKQIAHKSHSGSKEDYQVENYADNFGAIPLDRRPIKPSGVPKKVKLLKNNCVIYFYQGNESKLSADTMCDHPYFSGQYTMDEIKTFFLPDTEFEGFKGKFFNDSIKQKPIEKKNSFHFLVALFFFGAGFMYIFKPKVLVLKLVKSSKLMFLLLCFTSFAAFSQTKQIAHKSHSGTSDDFNPTEYADNFGLDENAIYHTEKVKYINEKCVVQYGVNYHKQKRTDTLCNHPYFSGQYSLEQIKTFYPEDTKFEGFEGKYFNKTEIKPNEKKNSFNWIFVLVFLGAGSFYVLRPTLKLGVRN